ncbi:MAG: hypothetical protein AABX50_02350 [Nanoarchaeota archaeon]
MSLFRIYTDKQSGGVESLLRDLPVRVLVDRLDSKEAIKAKEKYNMSYIPWSVTHRVRGSLIGVIDEVLYHSRVSVTVIDKYGKKVFERRNELPNFGPNKKELPTWKTRKKKK